MTILIDSMIWIYFFDKNSLENIYVEPWMKKILKTESIILPSIIPLEVGHNLYDIPRIDLEIIKNLLMKWLTQENITIINLDELVMVQALEQLKKLRQTGIGGRDCIILSSMILNDVKMDLKTIVRIDPGFKTPLKWEFGENFDRKQFERKLN